MARLLVGRDRTGERDTQQRLQDRVERRYIRELEKEFRQTMKQTAKHFEETGNVKVDDEHAKRIGNILKSEAATTIEVFTDHIREALKDTIGPHVVKTERDSLVERLFQEWMRTRGMETAEDDIASSTRRQIARMVAQGREAGEGTSEIARRINSRINHMSRLRSETIARTESHAAANYAQTEAIKDAGVKARKEWISARDDRTRDGLDSEFDHVAANGQAVELDEPFQINGESLMFPGDPAGSAGNVINCRCATGFIVDD